MIRTERREWQCHRKLRIARRVIFVLLALVPVLVCVLLLTGGDKADTPEPEAVVTGPAVMPEPQRPKQEAVDPLEANKIALAKMVWGEARGYSTTEQAAAVWCVLSRYDGEDRFWADTVEGTATQPCRLYGYNPGNPVDPDILVLVGDVLVRWMAKKDCMDSVGWVLPRGYLYFTSDGVYNYFTTGQRDGQTWDWSLESPYEE